MTFPIGAKVIYRRGRLVTLKDVTKESFTDTVVEIVKTPERFKNHSWQFARFPNKTIRAVAPKNLIPMEEK